MDNHKPDNSNPTISTPSIRHWLHNCAPSSHGASNPFPSFSMNEPSLLPDNQHRHQHKDQHSSHPRPHQHHDQQQQQETHAQSVQTYSPYSHILDDSDKALLATIQLGPGSADRALSSQTINNTITTSAANSQQISMCSIPALLPGMESSYHPSTDWESEQQQLHLQLLRPTDGHRSPFLRHLTPMTELDSVSSSGHSNNDNPDSPHLLNSCVSDNHNHRYQNHHHHHTLHNANNSSSNPTAILPDQETILPHHPSALTHNHHHQYGAVDGISAAFLHLTHLYHPLSHSPSVSVSPPPFPNATCSPSNTPFSSSYPPPSPSPSLSLAYPSPHHPNSFGINSTPVTFGGPDESTFLDVRKYGMYTPKWPHSRPLVIRSTPVTTRRRSQALLKRQCLRMSSPLLSASPVVSQSYIVTRRRSPALLAQNSLLSVSKKTTDPSMVTKPNPLPFSRLSTSNTSPSPPLHLSGSLSKDMNPSPRLSSSPRYNPLICSICRKEYANNSTLRRHAKIHAYASASSAARKIASPSPAMSSSLVHGACGSPAGGLHSGGPPTISTLEAVNTHLLSSFWPYRDNPAITLPGSLKSTSSTNTSSVAASGGGGTSNTMNGNAVATPGQVLQVATTTAPMTMLPGYNPGYDPAIKKPECAGCNKPFARRDTVILHIKNQKRKWDLMCATLPKLAVLAASDSSTSTDAGTHCGGGGGAKASGGGSDGEGDNGGDDDAISISRRTSSRVNVPGSSSGTTTVQRQSVRQKKLHPFRVAEKLWQLTLQKKKIHFGPYKTPPVVTVTATTTTTKRVPSIQGSGSHGRASRPSSSFGYRVDDDDEFDYDMYIEGQYPRQHQHQMDGDMEMMNAYVEPDDDEDENERGEDGWPSEEALELMDNATKIQWMMKMAVVPPCWSERKVRIFGVQGRVEEMVLQDC